MTEASTRSLLEDSRPGTLGLALGRIQGVLYRLAGMERYDAFRIEQVSGMSIVVAPSVANPRLLRTGAYFASQLTENLIQPEFRVLDLGTGSGICALVAARFSGDVVGIDINPAAIRCARANALMNNLEHRTEFLHGDLFAPVTGRQFDLVLFNPPFLKGEPSDAREAAWRSVDIPQRFSAELADHLKPTGSALLLLSSFGDACPSFETELRAKRFAIEVFASRRYINETITILRAGLPHPDNGIEP